MIMDVNTDFDGNTNVVGYEIIGWHENDTPEDMKGFKYIKYTKVYLCQCRDNHGGIYYMMVDWDDINHKWLIKTGLTVLRWTPIKKLEKNY